MASLERAIERLKSCHPRARYFQWEEVGAGKTGAETEDQVFQSIHLYEHRITNRFEPILGHKFIISNGFISSHIYNLALVWIRHMRFGGASKEWLAAATRHNYKNFFAECLLDQRNCLAGRALLLETLVYEQDLMRGLFDQAEAEVKLKEIAQDIAHMMSTLLGCHELGHYFFQRSPEEFNKELNSMLGGALFPMIRDVEKSDHENLAEELTCDAFAAHQAIYGNDSVLNKYDEITRARMAAFHFIVFPDLASLEKSAGGTAKELVKDEEIIDLSSELRPKEQFEFAHDRCQDIDFRSTQILALLEKMFGEAKSNLYGEDGNFPLLPSCRENFNHAFANFANESKPLDGGGDIPKNRISSKVIVGADRKNKSCPRNAFPNPRSSPFSARRRVS